MSQAFVPEHVSGSSALVTATQVPLVPVQDWQVPQAASEQQCPSTQAPLLHWLAVAAVHRLPAPDLDAQVPVDVQ
jgi:hypothetical protein